MSLLAVALAIALPQHGVLVPGRSLGGVQLGMTQPQVERAWGTNYGRCRNCVRKTWYFNYEKYHAEGAAVRFRNGRVDAVWTLWKPDGWRAGKLALGAPAPAVTAPLRRAREHPVRLVRGARPHAARCDDDVLRVRRQALGLRAQPLGRVALSLISTQ